MRKIFDYVCVNDLCEAYGQVEERLVKADVVDAQICEDCEDGLHRMPVAPAGWLPSKERTMEQLKTRSLEHSRKCRERGVSPDDDTTNSFNSCAKWRNKHRVKNTSKTTITDLASANKIG